MTDFAGKGAFVSGGASGIGRELGLQLIDAGAKVVFADIDAAGAEKVAAEARERGGEAIGIGLDVTDEAAWVRAGEQSREFTPVRLLLSNAGVGGGSGAFETYDTDVWRWGYAVNAHSHLYACRTFLGEMKQSGERCHLLLTASMVAIVPPPISTLYVSAKFATLGIAMSLRNELFTSDVGISVLLPGMGATNVVANTAKLRPVAHEQGQAQATSAAMKSVLSGGMAPDKIAAHTLTAMREDRFWIFTHPEWKAMAEAITADMLAGFGPSADPDYPGDNIDGLIAANGGHMFGAENREKVNG